MVVLDEEDRQIGQVIDRLMGLYPDVPRDTVYHLVGSARRRFDEAPIRDFVPPFVERQTKERLAAINLGPA